MKPLLRLLGFLLPVGGWVALATLLGLATVMAATGLLATSAYLISAAALRPPLAALDGAIYLVRLSAISRAFVRYAERLVSHDVTFRLIAVLREWLYARLVQLAPGQLMAFRSADLLSRLARDVDEAETFFQALVGPAIVAVAACALASAGLWRVDPVLGLVSLITWLALGAGVPLLAYHLAAGSGRMHVEERAALDIAAADALEGMPDVLGCGRDLEVIDRLALMDARLGVAQRRTAWVVGLRLALEDSIGRLGAWAILLLALPLVAAHGLDAVYLATLAFVVLGVAEAVQPVGRAIQHLGRTRAAAERIWAVADTHPALEYRTSSPQSRSTATRDDARVGTALELERVSFAYAGAPTLHDISLRLVPGRTVAVVGPSGAGKSTLLQLAARAWDPSHGQVRLSGRDLRDFLEAELAAWITLISQDIYLFSATVRDNLRVAMPEASDTEMHEVLGQVGLASLPCGLDTWVGDQGMRLSGGERQRLGFARALLRPTPFILLDEVTAHLDAVAEQSVLATVERLARIRGILIATHRLAHLERVDEIVVLDAGRVVERGTHTQLSRAGGRYARLLATEQQVFNVERVAP